MNKMPGRLGSLCARDVMSREVLILKDTMSLEEATAHLKSRKHSGAPVVNSHGTLIGTFSLRNLSGLKKKTQTDKEADSEILTAEVMERMLASESAPQTVAECMTRNAPSATENASLIDVARLMCSFHTHRIPITNTTGKLAGIVTTMDILAAVVHTADELGE